ncbi:hypothetical protein IscW_ISCW002713 [Ixodes scapularis]|uniref:Uncharacterized protein n=1 Tax=Ixodes scapularis TaxID=6945 RepID=B7P8K8_IXOSC|nr:hypothetical protein IscW_ISCW002713 [Ixodes scapularis]|eukprot:XP_002402444.1 hypothetical protein IscW_ISCW002713 [Ixodes scapularis]
MDELGVAFSSERIERCGVLLLSVRQFSGDLPTFVPVETILKEDGAPISVSGEKPGSLMMNLETRELFLSTDAASQQFSLSSSDKSNQPKEDETGAGKQWDCNLCSPGLKKALQRERLQVLRQNPSYREMERLRQRSMMQLKRQDPSFRALERERQRARMQLRRQDPSFRQVSRNLRPDRGGPFFSAMERERQRRRMRLKRRDPAFREREREQQKSRLMIKRTGEKGPLLAIAAPPPPSGPPGTNTTTPPTTVATSTASVPHHHHHQPQQHQQAGGKGCVGSQHEAPKREAALYGHLQRIVGYHNLLQVRNPHPEEPGSPFKSPYFTAGELNASSGALVPRRMGTVPQTGSGSHPAGGGHQGAATGTKAHQHQALLARQKGFLDGTVSPCHPLGEVFAASYPTMRDQVLGGGQSCSSLETTPHLQTAVFSHPLPIGVGLCRG